MSGSKSKDWILETIDQLRRRKARPDIDRICHMVKRKFGLSFKETEALLEKLVDEETVIKVDYKGSTSYRNASKWRKSHLGGHVLNSNTASLKIQDAVKALTAYESTQKNVCDIKGASVRDIEKWLLANDDNYSRLKSPLQVALRREEDCGRLKKLPNGNYITESHSKLCKGKCNQVKSIINHPVPAKRGRPPKKKKFLSDNDLMNFGDEKYSTDEPVTSAVVEPDEKCDYCLLTAECNKRGLQEHLLICIDCNAKAHPSCMNYSDDLARRACNSPWQCIDCKTCYICTESSDADTMLFCDACDKGYHMVCHDPPVKEKPSGKWACANCCGEGVNIEEMDTSECKEMKNSSTGDDESLSITTNSSSISSSSSEKYRVSVPIQSHNHETEQKSLLSKLPKVEGSTYPDASEWSISDVCQFLISTGFKEQAGSFEEQEIDGKSLLLMKRSDVLTGLALKLGPALKIYKHIQKLQTAWNDWGHNIY